MAQLLEIDQLIIEERKRLQQKREEFRNNGKTFRFSNHGPGIVPDEIYNALRDPSDKKFKATPSRSGEGQLAKVADGDRAGVVDMFVVHHSVGPEFRDVDHDTIADWYNRVGRTGGYAGVAHSGHTYKGRETFAQAQLAGHWHGGAWCIFPIMDDIWNNVAWHAGNWPINQRSIGIENCGRFNTPPDGAIMRALGEWWRPRDRELGGNSYVNPHRAVSTLGTACPELLGSDQNIDLIISYVNENPQPAPTPPAPQPAPSYNFVEETGKARVSTDGDILYFLDAPFITANVKGNVHDGTVMDYVGYTTQGSSVVGNTKWWKNKYGSWFSAEYAVKVEAPAPVPTPQPTPTPTPTPTPVPAPSPLDGKTLWDVTVLLFERIKEVLKREKF